MVPQKCPFLSPRAEKGAGICFSCILLSHPDFPPVMSVGYGVLPFHPCAHSISGASLPAYGVTALIPTAPRAQVTAPAPLMGQTSQCQPQQATKSLLARIHLLVGQPQNYLPGGRETQSKPAAHFWGIRSFARMSPKPPGSAANTLSSTAACCLQTF